MRCCEAVEDWVETSSIECIDSQIFSQINASLARENFEGREAEVLNLPWTQTEKDTALARCRSGPRAWRKKKPVLSLSTLTDEEEHPSENGDDSWKKTLSTWEPFSRHSRNARGITNTKIFCDMSNNLFMTSVGLLIRLSLMTSLLFQTDSASGPDGIPYCAYRCAGGLGSKFLFDAYKAVGRKHYPWFWCWK